MIFLDFLLCFLDVLCVKSVLEIVKKPYLIICIAVVLEHECVPITSHQGRWRWQLQIFYCYLAGQSWHRHCCQICQISLCYLCHREKGCWRNVLRKLHCFGG